MLSSEKWISSKSSIRPNSRIRGRNKTQRKEQNQIHHNKFLFTRTPPHLHKVAFIFIFTHTHVRWGYFFPLFYRRKTVSIRGAEADLIISFQKKKVKDLLAVTIFPIFPQNFHFFALTAPSQKSNNSTKNVPRDLIPSSRGVRRPSARPAGRGGCLCVPCAS